MSSAEKLDRISDVGRAENQAGVRRRRQKIAQSTAEQIAPEAARPIKNRLNIGDTLLGGVLVSPGDSEAAGWTKEGRAIYLDAHLDDKTPMQWADGLRVASARLARGGTDAPSTMPGGSEYVRDAVILHWEACQRLTDSARWRRLFMSLPMTARRAIMESGAEGLEAEKEGGE